MVGACPVRGRLTIPAQRLEIASTVGDDGMAMLDQNGGRGAETTLPATSLYPASWTR